MSIEDKKELITDVNKYANIGKVVSTTISYSDSEVESTFSSEGSKILTESSKVGLFLNAVASNGKFIQLNMVV